MLPDISAAPAIMTVKIAEGQGQGAARAAGLEHVRLGNIGVFARTEAQVERLLEATGGLAEGGTSDEG